MGPNSYIGSIGLFAGGIEPKGWTLCDGKILSIAEYFPLYSIIGTTYGGDGIVTFAVPDLRGTIASGEIPSRANLGSVEFRYMSSDTTNPANAQAIMTLNYCIAFEGVTPEADTSTGNPFGTP